MKIQELKRIIFSNRLQETILNELGLIPDSAFNSLEGRKEGAGEPCPFCGGTDRFKLMEEETGEIVAFCRHKCFNGKSRADLFEVIRRALNISTSDAMKRVEEWLEMNNYIDPRQRTRKERPYMTSKTQTTASATLEMTSERVAYSEQTDDAPAPGKLLKTTFFHRLNPISKTTATFRRDDFNAPKPKNKRTQWIETEKDANGATVYAPYIAGAATSTKEPPRGFLSQLWERVATAPRLYIVEGEKCAESLKNALDSAGIEGEVLTMGASDLAPRWGKLEGVAGSDWAAYIAKRNCQAEIFIFGDNDGVGRKAARTTARAFYSAGYSAISTFGLATRPNGEPAPKGYDVADWLEESTISALLALARPFDHLQDEYERRLVTALKIRKEHALRQERARAEREVLSFDARDDNASFPMDITPEKYQTAIKKLGTKNRVPFGVCNFYFNCILSATIGAYKHKIQVSDDEYNCQLGGIVVGISGSGKSRAIKELLKLVDPFQDELSNEFNSLVNRKELIENELKKAVDEGSNEKYIETIKKKLRVIDSVKPSFVVSDFSSVASLRSIGSVNCNVFETMNHPLNGMFLYFDDSLKTLGAAGTTTLDAATSANLKGLFALTDFDRNQSDKVSDKERAKLERERIGASICSIIQPKTFKAWSSESVAGVGAFQRQRLFFCDRARHDPNHPVDPCAKFRADLEPIRELFTQCWNWRGGVTTADEGYEEAYTKWFNDVEALRDELLDRGEGFLEGWAAKRQGDIHAEAFLLRVQNHVANGGKLEDLPPLSADDFRDAVKLFDYELGQARRTAAIMDATAKKGAEKKTVVTVEAAPLAPKIADVYQKGRAGTPCDLTQGDALGRLRTVTELGRPEKGGTTYYKANRETIDAKLSELGLLVIDPRTKGRNDKGARVFLPDDLSSQEYERLIKTLEGDDFDDDVQEEPIDATPQDVISLNGVDRASQSNRRIEKVETFPEFDQFDDDHATDDGSEVESTPTDDEEIPF